MHLREAGKGTQYKINDPGRIHFSSHLKFISISFGEFVSLR